MERLTVIVVGHAKGQERIYSRLECDRYDPNQVESMIEAALSEALHSVGGADEAALRELGLQVVVSPVTGELRPSFYLSASVLERLARARASFDFDPYA